MDGSRSFEERVFARFDALNSRRQRLETKVDGLEANLARIASLKMKRAAPFIVALLALVLASVVSCQRAPQAGSTVVLIVRHAEKASEADDSPLTEAGVQRAQELVRVAADAGVSAIYTTQFVRNRETARPLAERLGIAVTEVPVALQAPGEYGKTLARRILEQNAGQTVLVVGHSNTVASTIEGLTGRAPQLNSVEYQDLFIVTLPPGGTPHVIKAQYGLKPAG